MSRCEIIVSSEGINVIRQRNIDWAISEALRHYIKKRDLRSAMILYDIACQYHVHLKERFLGQRAGSLYLPDSDVQILYGIGLFHVHGHRPSCFPEFAPTYIRGAGMLDGELIETLWSLLKGMIRSTRGMATSHRKEVLDDHMNDINWNKTTRQGMYYGCKQTMWLTESNKLNQQSRSIKQLSQAFRKAYLNLESSLPQPPTRISISGQRSTRKHTGPDGRCITLHQGARRPC